MALNFAVMERWQINSVKPHFMYTHLIQTPRYYGQFALSLGKDHTFPLNSTRLTQTPFLDQWTDPHRKLTSLMQTIHYQRHVFTNLSFLKEKKISSWEHVVVPSSTILRIQWFVDASWRLRHQTSYAEISFY